TSLDLVTSKSTYKRLCALREDLPYLTRIKNDFDNPQLWRFAFRDEQDDDQDFDANSRSMFEKLLKDLEPKLIHIPLRNMWMDELPEWMTAHKIRLFTIAACSGHQHLLRSVVLEFESEGYDISAHLATFCLRYAVINGDTKVVEILLGIDGIHASDHGNSAIQQACDIGYNDIVKMLLEMEEVDPTVRNNDAFVSACMNGHVEIVKMLLQVEDVDPCDQENRAIKYAAAEDNNQAILLVAKFGQLEVVKMMLDSGERVNSDVQYKMTEFAAEKGHLEKVKWLMFSRGIGKYPGDVSLLPHGAKSGHVHVLKFLLELRGGSLREARERGALVIASLEGQLEVARYLVAGT
ncbi:hypothetical protein HDU76_010457, partial [Blyttiomyces sp. JEL0837]